MQAAQNNLTIVLRKKNVRPLEKCGGNMYSDVTVFSSFIFHANSATTINH